MSEKAKIMASRAVGRKLATAEIKVLGTGRMCCIPNLAKIAALPNPTAENIARPMANTRGYRGRWLSIIDWNIRLPSLLPNRGSQLRSGWGIMPKIFPSRLMIPAMLFTEPLGFAVLAATPLGSL